MWTPPPQHTLMRALGVLLLLVGLGVIVHGLGLDTTVPVTLGARDFAVNNIGLLADKQNILLIGGVLSVVGAILSRSGRASVPDATGTVDEAVSQRVPCPHCRELIVVDAPLCRFCQRSVEWPDAPTAVAKDSANLHDSTPSSGSRHSGAFGIVIAVGIVALLVYKQLER